MTTAFRTGSYARSDIARQLAARSAARSRAVRAPLKLAVAAAEGLAADGDVRSARRSLLRHFDDALNRQLFGSVDNALRDFDFVEGTFELAVTILMTTKPAREQLTERERAVKRFAARVRATVPERAANLLPHIS